MKAVEYLSFKQTLLPHGSEAESVTRVTGSSGEPAIMHNYIRKINMGDSWVMIMHLAGPDGKAVTMIQNGIAGEPDGDGYRIDHIETIALGPDGSSHRRSDKQRIHLAMLDPEPDPPIDTLAENIDVEGFRRGFEQERARWERAS